MVDEEIIEVFEKAYKVHDLNLDDCKLLFILESPHIQELKHGVPVAGASGKTMAKSLSNSNAVSPLGLLVKELHNLDQQEYEWVRKIGLMNVCSVPMQRTAYSEVEREKFDGFFDLLEKVRTTNQRNYFKEPAANDLQNYILQRFTRRLSALQGRTVTIVPCGRFAQKFLNLAREVIWDEKWKLINEVPHPSYNSWARERYKPAVEQILVELNK